MRPITDKVVWKLMFMNRYAYMFMLFTIFLICTIIDPGFFLGNDNPYNWLSIVFAGVLVLASGPYCWYTCSQMADRIAAAVRPESPTPTVSE